MMEDIKIILSYDGKQRYVSYGSSVMGSNMLGPMTPEAAEHIVACLEACRWRKIETAPLGEAFLVSDGVSVDLAETISNTVCDSLGNRLSWATHWRPIGPLPGGDE